MPIYKPEPLKGLSGLPEEEITKYANEQVALGKLPKNWKFSQADRLYKNQQFRDKFTPEVYAAITDKTSENYMSPEERDLYYDYDEYSRGIKDKFANDPNLPNYMTLTLDGMKDLWDSGIMSPEELQEKEDQLNALRRGNESNKFTPKSKLVAALIAPTPEDSTNPSVKDVTEAIKYERGLLNEEERKKYERKINTKAQEAEDLLAGTITTGLSDDEVDSLISKLYSDNRKKEEEFRVREDNRVLNLPAVKSEIDSRVAMWNQEVADGKLTLEDIRTEYGKLFDNDIRKDGAGSRYYTGYKNRSELANFGVDDMLEKLAQFSVLSEAYGDSAKAMQTVDSGIFSDVKNNQGFWKKRLNTIIGVGAKANAMAANELFGGYVDLYHSITDNPEEYKVFKTAEDVLNRGGAGFLLNPNYWNYVDQYGVWNPAEIQRLNQNGGIGGHQNVYSPTGKMTAEQFIDEGFKMLGYMLPGVAITALTKNVPRTSAWASVLSGLETFGSAAALGSAYSSRVYNKITLEADQALNEKFNEEAGDYIHKFYNSNPDFIKNYIKDLGISENDSSLLLLSAQQKAGNAMYEAAKEEYFKENEDRREAYDEDYKQILTDAKLGASIDNYIETARMVFSNNFWGKWTKSKLTRDLRNKGYDPIRVVEGVAKPGISKTAARIKAGGMAMMAGGVDNGLDDITAGIGSGLGLGLYNNYLGTVYSPRDYVEGAKYAADVVDGILYGMDGAEAALYDPQTWIDTAIGAAGTVLGTRVNGITLIRDMVKKNGAFSGEGSAIKNLFSKGEKTIDNVSASGLQLLDRYVTNGLTTSMADADQRYARTEEYIEKLNDEIFPKFAEDIKDFGSVINEQMDFNLLADNILDAKDAKQIGMVKSAVRMLNAFKDPVLAQLPAVQEFADFVKRGKKGDFTYAELQSFINDPNNINIKNAKDSEGNDTSESLAAEAMQKNINNYLEVFDNYRRISKTLDRSEVYTHFPAEARTQLAVQLTLEDTWQKRLDSMQESLGLSKSEKTEPFSRIFNRDKWNYEAEFGSKKGKERVLNSLQNIIDKEKTRLAVFEGYLASKRELYKKATTAEEQEKLLPDYMNAIYLVETLRNTINEVNELMKEKDNAKVNFDENGNVRTLSKEEIMHLSPRQRARILDPANYRDYSPEQVKVIKELSEELKNHINEDGTSQNLLQVALDAGVIQERLEASQKSIREIAKSPQMVAQYADRLSMMRDALIAQSAIDDMREADFEKLASVTNPQEAIDIVYRGKHPGNSSNKGFYIRPEIVKEYIEDHPESKELLSEAMDMVRTRDDLYLAADKLFEAAEAGPLKGAMASAVKDAKSKAEVISAVESLMDAQTSADAKMQYDRILDYMQRIGHQRDATKIRDRELEREKKREAELKRLEEEAKKDGKNYDWDGYKVGDVIYSKKTGHSGVVVGFEKTQEGVNKMLVRVKYANGEEATLRYDSTKSKDLLTKEAPKPVQEEVSATVTEIPEEPPFRDMSKYEQKETLDVPLDSDGATQSPTAEQQASAQGTTSIPVPKNDPTDQGNTVVETSGTVSGNRWVTYSIESLKEGIVREEVPDNPKSVFGQIVSWLKSKNINLQDIIDNKFGRILADNPDVEVQFMTLNPKMHSGLQKVLFPVVKVTDALRQKYNLDSGVIQANGESWLIVGTSGFESSASVEQRTAMDKMRAPINTRRNQYFQNSSEEYYVDPAIKTRVQSTTSGRIVNQGIGAEAPRLKKVSELLSSAGMSLRQGEFGTQTAQAGEKSFATTDNVKDKSKVFPPRNIEDNRGRTFILIETANGNKIPGMIEPAMLDDIAEDSPLRDIIDELLAQLASTNYEVRKEAIRELCGYLVLGEDKNILIGNEKFNALTIKRRGLPDISQELGSKFDLSKFLDDVASANFQINVSLKSLNNPAMLKIYDDSGALMTTVDSMRTAGMSYNLYMTDEHGNIITKTPVANAKPGTGRTEFKKYRSTRVNNTTYEFKNGQWVNRSNGSKVKPGTALEQSCNYNLEIQESGRSPIFARDNKEYFDMPNGENHYLISRDAFGNVEILDEAAANLIFKALEKARERQARLEALEDVNFEELTPTPKPQQRREEVPLTPEQIAAQEFGEFTTPQEIAKEQEHPTPQPVKETVREAKEMQSTSSKEAVTDMGTKSLEELQKSKNSYNFADVITNADYMDAVYQALEEANLGIDDNTTNAQIEKILKENKIPTVGITNIEDWINIIKCHSK